MAKTTIYSFSKGNGEEVRLSAGEFKDKIYFDVRIFYKNPETDEMFPTKKGITLPVDYLAELKKGLLKLDPSQLKSKSQDPRA